MWLLLWITILGVYFTSAAGRFAESSRRLRRLIPSPNTQGLCRYGTKTECCYGWKRNSKGQCEATCEQGCKHGECVGLNKCKCFPGFTGNNCSQDLNECGLKPRPCEHRCMNTHGSYKCYCLNGYMLMPDGSCSNSRTCAMSNCQYGCEEVKGEVRCLCPSSGLQLGPDGRSCIDIDECATGKALCHFNRRCVNTFGSYYCKCQHGFDLKYVNGRYDCLDINECLVGTHKCSPHSDCLNTPGSYKCRCKQGYKGSGYVCSAIPDKPVKESPKIIGSAKDTIKKLLAHKNSLKRNEEMKNLIPEPIITPSPKTRLQPFDYVDGVYIGGTYHEENEEFEHNEDEEEEEEEEEDDEDDDYDNGIGQEKILRGDVFALQVKREEPAFRSSVISQKATSLNSEEVSIDCSFDRGACDWKQETEDDFDWKHTNRSHGTGFYLSVPATAGHKKAVGRLRLPLTNLRTNSKSCLIFTYHLFGEKFGKLRVYMNENSDPIWEENRSNNKGWRIARVEIPETHDISSSKIIFESERGKGNHGEMALDNVFLVSGPCTED
ncbi:epidermal growth factor-like protein 6 isoform X1 [Dendropsophus ebraccatus]|uniref:epidermal growth factor-like protein 6 isoform X1 n=1 Tax=Dendropsophus ebraccatus TaxID=150705 RepID=UPI0038322B9D